MALDRWIALVILLVFLAYGYAAWFTMDASLPPILQRNPIWPSSFPKVLSIAGALVSLAVIFNLEKSKLDAETREINYRRLHDYRVGQAALLLGFMVAYALLLRPLGFLISTFLFLTLSSYVLGERRLVITMIVAAVAAGIVWYLVEQVLGIFLRPLPTFL
ncbi:MAG: tripartite tricarboxylate transporter TctB family protein [Pseudomonadota bacterium]